MSEFYKQSGVNIDAGNEFVNLIKQSASKTITSEVIGNIGGFSALFELNIAHYSQPVLVSSTDGVGTKLKLASDLGILDTIGQDLVAMCVNDILCSGAKPLFFLDYFAKGKLEPENDAEIINGIAKACEQICCPLIGGETAEMPGIYKDKDFDLAGFVVGIVEKSEIIDGSTIKPGDLCIGLTSSGIHSNGFSLVRHLIQKHNIDAHTIAHDLLAPTHLYPNPILNLLKEIQIHGIAHITGGGLWENLPRILPKTVKAVIHRNRWRRPPIFDFIQKLENIEDDEFLRIFNAGIGMIIIVSNNDQSKTQTALNNMGFENHVIGSIVQRHENEPQMDII